MAAPRAFRAVKLLATAAASCGGGNTGRVCVEVARRLLSTHVLQGSSAAADVTPSWPYAAGVARRHQSTHPLQGHTAADVLRRKRLNDTYSVPFDAPLSRCLTALKRSHAVIVVNSQNSVVGLLTAHDVIKSMSSHPLTSSTLTAADLMTAGAAVVCVSPTDTISDCVLCMVQMNISHLPVMSNGEILGLISLNDIAQLTLESAAGGKSSALKVVVRRGMMGSAKLRDGNSALLVKEAPLFLRTGACALPRAMAYVADAPHASEDSFFTAHMRYCGGTTSVVTDAASLGCDNSPAGHTVSHFGIADGVGSWAERGVDPKRYARRLMEQCALAAWDAAAVSAAATPSPSSSAATTTMTVAAAAAAAFPPVPAAPTLVAAAALQTATETIQAASSSLALSPPSPVELLSAAWEATSRERVVGSATAAVVSLDSKQNQLTVHTLGDCGMILLRDTDVSRVGTLLRGGTSSGIRAGWRVSARATQQLRRFNEPYQLGWAPGSDGTRFNSPWQGETLALPVHAEDIVILASDGLYDNLDESAILEVVEKWDREDISRRRAIAAARKQQLQLQQSAPTVAAAEVPARNTASAAAAAAAAASETDAAARTPCPSLLDGESIGAQALATRLAHAARTASVDKGTDGPFARLAKENDILWRGGGRPDDITVVVARVSHFEPRAPVCTDAFTDLADDAALRVLGSLQARALNTVLKGSSAFEEDAVAAATGAAASAAALAGAPVHGDAALA